MPERKKATRKPAAPTKTVAKKKPIAKRATAVMTMAAVKTSAEPAARSAAAPAAPAAEPRTTGEVCPRCGTSKFGPEQRIRAEGSRTVRYTILVCERGHTFARPVTKTP